MCMSTAGLFAGGDQIHHSLTVTVNPITHYLEAEDVIIIPADQVEQEMEFLLLSDLSLVKTTPNVVVKLAESGAYAEDIGMDVEDYSASIRQNKYLLTFKNSPAGEVKFTLVYKGKINYPIQQLGSEYARGFSQSPGLIEERGVYLAGSTCWVPRFSDDLITFDLTVSLPRAWDAVSQGRRTRHEVKLNRQITRWNVEAPTEEVYLIAAEFHEYSQTAGSVKVMAFLRTPDETLAHKYLETTSQYLEMYRKLIGLFPFSKFALVENFWATGYGMPSFTLLGEEIIRFPFILHSSYPHELLHNWWGNSVYVDFERGNWCEGLTTYLADHLIKEQRGQGQEYRRTTLQKYTDYVTPENDFPLTEFINRYDAPSEAIGYGKSLMLFNMLRSKMGDTRFVKALQEFYRQYKFKKAGFSDIQRVFEEVSGEDLEQFFHQWTQRTGAPDLQLNNTEVRKKNGAYILRFSLQQVQKADPFILDIPVAVTFADSTIMKKVSMTAAEQTWEFSFPDQPLLLQIDPRFEIMRRLHYAEVPPSLSSIYGMEDILILLPSQSPNLEIYQELAKIWAKDKSKNISIKLDSDVDTLPDGRGVWVFGPENRHTDVIRSGIAEYEAEIGPVLVKLGKTDLNVRDNSIILAVRHPADPRSVAVWLTIHDREAVPGLARKLPHYGKYSYLAFQGKEPTNIAKGEWGTVNSPLTAELDAKAAEITPNLPHRPALAYLAPVFSAERMMEHIHYLAGEELEGRGAGSKGIEKAAAYIANAFNKAGLQPGAEGDSYFQTWTDVIDDKGHTGELKNVVGLIPGTDPDMKGESVIVCAHYDHLGLGWPDVRPGNKGKIHPGADDNASGVAVMLELAQLLAGTLKPPRSVLFIAFSGEENGLKGSRYYVNNSTRFPADKVIGVLNLDTVGRLFDKKLLVLNSSSAREWKFIFMGAGYVTGVEAEMVTQDLDASDQTSFIKAGVPGVQFFTGPHEDYHRPTDTVEKIDAAGLVKVAAFVREGIVYLAERKEPLSFTGSTEKAKDRPAVTGGKRASTGSMPDFTYSGKGVKIGAVGDDSPADRAGLQKGDIIIRLGEYKITDLRQYSQVLAKFSPGDQTKITFLREGKEMTATIELRER